MLKLAYVITADRNPSQLRRLVSAIYKDANTYVLHVDRNAPRDVHAAVRDLAGTHHNCIVIPSQRIVPGSWRLADAQIRGVKAALAASTSWQYCISLTSQDYPLLTQQEISTALRAGPEGANYVETLDPAEAGQAMREFLDFVWIPWRGRMVKLLRRRRPPLEVFCGCNAFALSRSACEMLVHSEASRRLQRYLRRSLHPEQFIVQTLLMRDDWYKTVVGKHCRKMIPDGDSAQPKVLTLADLPNLLTGDAWFARGFDETVDSKVLDELDLMLELRDSPKSPIQPAAH